MSYCCTCAVRIAATSRLGSRCRHSLCCPYRRRTAPRCSTGRAPTSIPARSSARGTNAAIRVQVHMHISSVIRHSSTPFHCHIIAGDLGGPLMGMQNNRFHVIGLYSYVTSRHPIRDDSLPGVYTRVGFHLPWIHKVLTDRA